MAFSFTGEGNPEKTSLNTWMFMLASCTGHKMVHLYASSLLGVFCSKKACCNMTTSTKSSHLNYLLVQKGNGTILSYKHVFCFSLFKSYFVTVKSCLLHVYELCMFNQWPLDWLLRYLV